MPKNSLTAFYQRLFILYRRYFGYLFKLCLIFFMQLILFFLSIGLFFLNLVPLYLSLSLIIFTWTTLAIGLVGILKNLQALVKGRGQEKYPIFMLDYFFSGYQLLTYLCIFLSPLLISVFILVYGFYTSANSLIFLSFSLFLVSFFIQWYFGLNLVYFLDKKNKHSFNWKKTYTIIESNKVNSLVLIIANYFVFIFFSLFLPVFGTIFSLIWIVLSSFYFYYYSFSASI